MNILKRVRWKVLAVLALGIALSAVLSLFALYELYKALVWVHEKLF